jgi:hypothetical protein
MDTHERVGVHAMRLQVGDAVRVRPNPEVDETLWDEQGFVLEFDRDNRPIVELGDGGDCAFNPDQLDLVATSDEVERPGAPGPGPF